MEDANIQDTIPEAEVQDGSALPEYVEPDRFTVTRTVEGPAGAWKETSTWTAVEEPSPSAQYQPADGSPGFRRIGTSQPETIRSAASNPVTDKMYYQETAANGQRYPSREEVESAWQEAKAQSQEQFLKDNPEHAELAKDYDSFDEYLESAEYARATGNQIPAEEAIKAENGKTAETVFDHNEDMEMNDMAETTGFRTQADHWNELEEMHQSGYITDAEFDKYADNISNRVYEDDPRSMKEIFSSDKAQEVWKAKNTYQATQPHVESHTETFQGDGVTVEHTETKMSGISKRSEMQAELRERYEAGDISQEEFMDRNAKIASGQYNGYKDIDQAMELDPYDEEASTPMQDDPSAEQGSSLDNAGETPYEPTAEQQEVWEAQDRHWEDGMDTNPNGENPAIEPHVENAHMETIDLGNGATATKVSGVVHGGPEMTPERQAQMDDLTEQFKNGEITGKEYQDSRNRLQREWRKEDVKDAAEAMDEPSSSANGIADAQQEIPEAQVEPHVENVHSETINLDNGATVTKTSGVVHGGPEMTPERQAQMDNLSEQFRNGDISSTEFQQESSQMRRQWMAEDVREAAAENAGEPAHESPATDTPSADIQQDIPDASAPVEGRSFDDMLNDLDGNMVTEQHITDVRFEDGQLVGQINNRPVTIDFNGGTPKEFADQLMNDPNPGNRRLGETIQNTIDNGGHYQNVSATYADGSVYTNNGEFESVMHPDGSMDIRSLSTRETISIDRNGNRIDMPAPAQQEQHVQEGIKEPQMPQENAAPDTPSPNDAPYEPTAEQQQVWEAQDKHWEAQGYGQDAPAPSEPVAEPAANYTPQTVHVETIDGMSGDFHMDANGNIQVFSDSIQGAPGISPAEHVEAFMAEPSVQNAMLKAQSAGTMIRSNINGLELTRDFTINTPEGPVKAQMTMDMSGKADITFNDKHFDSPDDYFKAEAEAFQTPEAQSIQGSMDNCRNVLNNQFSTIEDRISNLDGLRTTPSETFDRMETEAFTVEQPNGRIDFHSMDAADMMDANETLLNMPDAELTDTLNSLGQDNPEIANWLSELFSTPGMKIALLVGLAAIVALVAMSVIKASRLAEEQRLAEAQQERQETVAKELGDAKSNPSSHEKEAGNTAAMARSAADHEENRKSAGMKQPDSGETDTASSSQKNENVAPAMEETIETPDKQQDIPEQEQAKAAPDNKENISSSSVSSKDDGKKEKSEESDKDKEKPEAGKDEAEAEEEKTQKATENSIAENIAKGAEAEPQNTPESTDHASDEKEKKAKDENPAKAQPEMHTADTTTPDIADAEDSKGIDETVTDTEKAASDVEKTIDGEMAKEAKDGDSHDKKEPAGTEKTQEKVKENPVREDSMHEESVKDKEDKDETVHDGPEPEPQVHDDTMIPVSPDTPDPIVIPTPETITEPAAEKHENALISWEIDKNSGSLILGGDITKKGLERVLAEAEKDALANGYRIDNLVIGNETTSIQPCALTALEGRSPDSKVSPTNLVLEIDKAHKDAYRSIEACKAFIIPESLANVAIKNYAPDACLSIKDDKTFRHFHTVLTQNVDYIPDNFMGYAKIDQLLQRDTDPDHRMSIGRNAFGQEGPEAERILKTKDPVGHAPNEKTDEKTEHEKMDEHLQPLGHKLSNEHVGWMMDEKASRESLEKLNASMERDNTNRIAALTQARDELIKKRDELVASAKNSPKWILGQYRGTEEYAKRKDELLLKGEIEGKPIFPWSNGQCGGCDVWDKKIVEMQKKADKLIERYEKLNLPKLDGVINDLKELKNRDFKAERVKLVNEFLQPYLDAVVCSEYMKTPEFTEKMQTFDNKELIKGYKELTEAIGKMDEEIAELGGKHQEILSTEYMQHVRNARDNKEMLVGISVSSLGDSAFENQALRFLPGEDAKTYIQHLEKSIPEMDPENQKLAREMIDNVRRGKIFIAPNGVKLGAYALANTNSEGLAEDVNNHISLNAIKKKYDAEIERLKSNREELVSKGQDTTQVDKQIREKDAEYKSRCASMLSGDASDRAVIHDNAVVNNDRAYLFDVKCNDEKMQKMTANCGKEIPEKGMMANISGKSPKKHKAADLDKEKRDYEKKERRDARGMTILGGLGGALSGMTDKDFSATKGLAYTIGTPLFFLALLIGKLGKKGIDCLKEMKNGKQPDLIKMYGLDGNTPEALKLAGRARYELASAVAIAAEKGPGESLLADLKNISEHLDPDRPEASSLISGSKDAQKLAVALVNSDYSLEEMGRLAIEFGSMQDGEHRAEEAKNLLEGLEKQIAEKEVQIKASSKEVGEKSLYNQNSRKIEDSFDKDLSKKKKEAEKILRENGRDASGKKLTKTEKIKMKAEDKARNNARKRGKGHTQEQ